MKRDVDLNTLVVRSLIQPSFHQLKGFCWRPTFEFSSFSIFHTFSVNLNSCPSVFLVLYLMTYVLHLLINDAVRMVIESNKTFLFSEQPIFYLISPAHTVFCLGNFFISKRCSGMAIIFFAHYDLSWNPLWLLSFSLNAPTIYLISSPFCLYIKLIHINRMCFVENWQNSSVIVNYKVSNFVNLSGRSWGEEMMSFKRGVTPSSAYLT